MKRILKKCELQRTFRGINMLDSDSDVFQDIVGAILIASNALEFYLQVKPWVRTRPISNVGVLKHYLNQSVLMDLRLVTFNGAHAHPKTFYIRSTGSLYTSNIFFLTLLSLAAMDIDIRSTSNILSCPTAKQLLSEYVEATEFHIFILRVKVLIELVGYPYTYRVYVGTNIGIARGRFGSHAQAITMTNVSHDTLYLALEIVQFVSWAKALRPTESWDLAFKVPSFDADLILSKHLSEPKILLGTTLIEHFFEAAAKQSYYNGVPRLFIDEQNFRNGDVISFLWLKHSLQHYCTHSLEIWLRSYVNHGHGVFGATHTILAVILAARARKDFNLSLSFGWLNVFSLFGGDTNDTIDVDYAKGLSQYEFLEGITRDSIHILGVGQKIKIDMPSSEYILVAIVKGTLPYLFSKHSGETEREWKSDKHEYVVRQLKEYDGKQLVSPTNEGFTVDENDVRENFDNALIRDAIFEEEVTDLVFLVHCISKFLMFSSPRPQEVADLEDKVNFKREECYVLE